MKTRNWHCHTRRFASLIFLQLLTPLVAAAGTASVPLKPTNAPAIVANDVLTVGQFGSLHIYRPTTPVTQVVLFLSGDGGWNQGVVSMAQQLQSRGALVAGIDIREYFKGINASHEKCAYLGADFERLSRLVQQHAGLREYHYPVLVGYSSGATLAYAVLNQAPKGIFSGGLSLGFCPDLELAKPLCKGEQLTATPRKAGVGVDLHAVAVMQDPWIVLQGEQDQVCAAAATEKFVANIQGAKFVSLPKVGHGYSVEKNWLPQFMTAFDTLSRAPQSTPPAAPPDLNDLPIVEIPAIKSNAANAAGGNAANDSFVILLTGDGGYAGMDQQVAAAFSAQGLPIAVLNSLKYFWTPRTPQQVADDVNRVIRYYAANWHKEKVILVGYSQGADVMPFVLNRLPDASKARIATVAAIGLSATAVFEFHIANWLTDPTGTPTMPELKRLSGVPFTCIYGADETDSVCPQLRDGKIRLVKLPGGHHFNGDYNAVANAVLVKIGQ